jgi:hypothetical protein
MKKFLTSFAVASIVAMAANAQNSTVATSVATAPNQQIMQKRSEMHERYKNASPEEREQMMKARDEKKERFENASSEQKARMEKRHEMMEKLSDQQREEVKKERDRHRAEMKRITGFEPESF